MEYTLLEKLYYKDKKQYENEYSNRFNGVSSIKFDIEIGNSQAFMVVTPEIINKINTINDSNARLNLLTAKLPGIALNQYIKKCIVDEIIITNEIEGVISTRRDITEILEDVKQREPHKRLIGLVNKYLKLNSVESLSIRNCQDIRDIYKDLVWEEILNDKPENLPDGVYFRKNSVDVKSQFHKTIHTGVMPEDKINRLMTKALDLLNDKTIIPIFRIAVFHYLFGYVHPFYDGNGRTSRFISSYLLSKNMNILSGYRLAYTIKDNINKYYKAFKIVNEEKNKGDLTPFVIIFLDIIIKEFNSLCQSLEEKSELMEYYKNIAVKLGNERENEINIVFILFQQTLFGNMGIGVKELVKESGESEYKVRQVIEKLENTKLLNKEKFGKKLLYSFNLDTVGEYIENN